MKGLKKAMEARCALLYSSHEYGLYGFCVLYVSMETNVKASVRTGKLLHVADFRSAVFVASLILVMLS